MSGRTGWGVRAVTVNQTVAGTTSQPFTAPCRLCGWSLLGLGGTAVEVDGSVTSPAANAIVVNSASLAVGDYTVAWSVALEGTVAAGTDNDNFQLRANSATIATSSNLGVVGEYPQITQTVRVTSVGTIAVRTGILATVGAIYRAQLVITPLTPSQSQILDGQQVLGVSGAQFGFSDTQWLLDDGIYVSGPITVSAITGNVSGCLYLADFDAADREEKWHQTKSTNTS